MRILYFAWVRERVGLAEEEITVPDGIATVGDLVEWLRQRDEGYAMAFADLRAVRAAADQEHVPLGHPLTGVKELAFFPPVTGG
jgi:molybdopterin synthase sulfur carrier subunit